MPLLDQGSVRRGSKYFYHRYLSGFLDRADPGSIALVRSIPATNNGSGISPVLPLSSIGSLAESKTRNPLASLSHDN